jgi:hypothetical protein
MATSRAVFVSDESARREDLLTLMHGPNERLPLTNTIVMIVAITPEQRSAEAVKCEDIAPDVRTVGHELIEAAVHGKKTLAQRRATGLRVTAGALSLTLPAGREAPYGWHHADFAIAR